VVRPKSRDGHREVELPSHIAVQWTIWRIVKSKIATLEEIRSFWDINDVAACNEILDAKEDAEYLAHEAAKLKIPPTTGGR